jgi:hypothetical protein
MSVSQQLSIGSDGEYDLRDPSQDRWINREASENARRAGNARNASGRRRLIDPTTCDRNYTCAELEFLNAIEEYKRRSARKFPTWSEVLEIIRDLGYRKSDSPSFV